MKANNNIACNVTECKHHAGAEDYCSLNQIKVVKNSTKCTSEKETDCHNFEPSMK